MGADASFEVTDAADTQPRLLGERFLREASSATVLTQQVTETGSVGGRVGNHERATHAVLCESRIGCSAGVCRF
jgi:3-methyladenine DNA glycosylase Mpg